jgi:hypothetical protein
MQKLRAPMHWCMQASVKALEMHVADIAAYIQKESTTIPKVEALIDACKLQSDDIVSLASSLPQDCRAAAAPAGPRTTTTTVLGNVSNTLRAGEGDAPRRSSPL